MSLFHQMAAEIQRTRETRGEPVCIKINSITKHALETEMRNRTSFNSAAALSNSRELVINRICQVDAKGHVVADGWEIPVEVDDNVPMNQFWVGVDGYEISRTQIGRKIPRNIIKGLNIN